MTCLIFNTKSFTWVKLFFNFLNITISINLIYFLPIIKDNKITQFSAGYLNLYNFKDFYKNHFNLYLKTIILFKEFDKGLFKVS